MLDENTEAPLQPYKEESSSDSFWCNEDKQLPVYQGVTQETQK